MRFKMIHENYNVADLDRSLDFYARALGPAEKRRKERVSFVWCGIGRHQVGYHREDRNRFERFKSQLLPQRESAIISSGTLIIKEIVPMGNLGKK